MQQAIPDERKPLDTPDLTAGLGRQQTDGVIIGRIN
jgi:hypothetical protein